MARLLHIGVTIVAIAASPLTMAETSVSPSRDEYDAYVAAFTLEQHVLSCRRYASGVYSSFAERLQSWRSQNSETMRRLEMPARHWPLPDGQSLDVILEQISVSTAESYAVGKGELANARCTDLFERLVASGNALHSEAPGPSRLVRAQESRQPAARPVTPVATGKSTRGVELKSVDDLDERQVAAWMIQVAAVPDVGVNKPQAR